MAINAGERLFYITGNGQIKNVIAKKDERNGSVEIGYVDTETTIGEIGTLHVCRTMRAAEIVAAKRRPSER